MNGHDRVELFQGIPVDVDEQAEHIVSEYVRIAAALKQARKAVLEENHMTNDDYRQLEQDVMAVVGDEGSEYGEWRINVRVKPMYLHRAKDRIGETREVFISQKER